MKFFCCSRKQKHKYSTAYICTPDFDEPETPNKNYTIKILIDNNVSSYITTDERLKNYEIVKTFIDKINKGACVISNKNKYFFLKIYNNEAISKDNQEIDVVKILKHNSHPHIINAIDYKIYETYSYVIYDYFESIDLNKYIHNFEPSEKNILSIIKQTALGLKFLHSFNIIHCDVKLENLLIKPSNGTVKITDYDLSKISDDRGEYQSDHIFGTTQYIAPESHSLFIYSRRSDIWMLGICIFIIVMGKYPYDEEISNIDSRESLTRRNVFRHIDYDTTQFHSQIISDLMDKILIYKDTDRLNCDEIVEYVNKHLKN